MTSSLSSFTRTMTLDGLNFGCSVDDREMVETLLDIGHCVVLRTCEADGDVMSIEASVDHIHLAFDVATIYCPNSFVIFPNGLGIKGENAKGVGRKNFTAIAMINVDGV